MTYATLIHLCTSSPYYEQTRPTALGAASCLGVLRAAFVEKLISSRVIFYLGVSPTSDPPLITEVYHSAAPDVDEFGSLQTLSTTPMMNATCSSAMRLAQMVQDAS